MGICRICHTGDMSDVNTNIDTADTNTTVDILELYKQMGAFHEGRFLLASGRQSPYFLQSTTLVQYPKAMMYCGESIAKRIQEAGWQPDFVVGPAMGGVALSYEVARQLSVGNTSKTKTPAEQTQQVRGIFAEKDGLGGMKVREAFQITSDECFVAIEDVVTTGGSLLRAVKAVERYGARCIGLCCIMDRREHGEGSIETKDAPPMRTLQGYPFLSLKELYFETYAQHEVPDWLAERTLQEI